MNAFMQEAFRASNWSSMCVQAESHASSMTMLCHYIPARQLIAQITNKFLRSPPPATDKEMELRRRQSWALSSIIGAVSHADSMAWLSPSTAGAMLQQVQPLCGAELPTTESAFAQLQDMVAASSMKIHSLSHEDSMRRLLGRIYASRRRRTDGRPFC